MPSPSLCPLLCLLGCVLLRGTTTSTDSSIPTVTGQSQATPPSPEVKNHTSEPSVKSTSSANLNLTSLGPTTAAKPSPTPTTPLALTTRDRTTSGRRNPTASPSQGQEPQGSERTTAPATQSASSFLSQRDGTSKPVVPTAASSGSLPVPTPTDDKSPLTVAAFGVISFIVILIVVVIILVGVVSLRFKCNHSKDSEDKQKPGSSMVSESCSAGTSQKDNSITLISMKNINMNNSMSYPPSEKVL
ncbi:endothelial cell-specific chemotaxis regulator isoform X1 [Colius striatus]|uniref:endothelial cell-specific chemotaxis regulator isoform X1 n=1 Tax=Colius striatus TaxID=57412 RepID=UPI002B1DD28D|nr:endothelial cell-specific chemotaxis regulator isoform X1 [Colius striatus]